MKVNPIRYPEDYDSAMRRASELMRIAELSQDEADELEVLAIVIEDYEKKIVPPVRPVIELPSGELCDVMQARLNIASILRSWVQYDEDRDGHMQGDATHVRPTGYPTRGQLKNWIAVLESGSTPKDYSEDLVELRDER